MVTADFTKKKLRLDPARGDDLRERTVLYTVGIGLEERLTAPVVVAKVLAGSSAAAAGIAVGDELVAIGGTAAGDLDAYSRAFALSPSRDGAEVEVAFVHEGVTSTKTLVAKDLLTSPTP